MSHFIHLNRPLAALIAKKSLAHFSVDAQFVICANMRLCYEKDDPSDIKNWIEWDSYKLEHLKSKGQVIYIESEGVGKYFLNRTKAQQEFPQELCEKSADTVSFAMPATHEIDQNGFFDRLIEPHSEPTLDDIFKLIQAGQDRTNEKLAELQSLIYNSKPAQKKKANSNLMPPFVFFKDVIIGSVFYDHFGQKFIKANINEGRVNSGALQYCMPKKKVYETKPKQ